jgi:hypothetical protein
MRVQVKSTSLQANGGRYRFSVGRGREVKSTYTTSQADIIALVAIDIRRVYFVPVKRLNVLTLRKNVADFTPYIEAETWHGSINDVIGSQWSD